MGRHSAGVASSVGGAVQFRSIGFLAMGAAGPKSLRRVEPRHVSCTGRRRVGAAMAHTWATALRLASVCAGVRGVEG